MRLDPRLNLIVQWAKAAPACRIHDLACDHGLVAAALALALPEKYIFASDIAEKPLQRAAATFAEHKLEYGTDFADFRNLNLALSDGLQAHTLQADDLVIVAGVSAQTLVNILAAAPELYRPQYCDRTPVYLLLQCMQDVFYVRQLLLRAGFSLLAEAVCSDKGKKQQVMLWRNLPYVCSLAEACSLGYMQQAASIGFTFIADRQVNYFAELQELQGQCEDNVFAADKLNVKESFTALLTLSGTVDEIERCKKLSAFSWYGLALPYCLSAGSLQIADREKCLLWQQLLRHQNNFILNKLPFVSAGEAVSWHYLLNLFR